MAAAALGPDELGAFLRREGVHEAELQQWREAVVNGATSAIEGSATKGASRGADAKRPKKFHTCLAERDRDTDEENEK